MSEFSFYLGPSERLKLIDMILAENGYFLVPNAPFDGPSVPKIYGKLTDAGIEERIPNGSAFIFGPFSDNGPYIRSLPGGGYRVSGNQGGPLFYLRIPQSRIQSNASYELRLGALGLESAFWDSEMNANTPPSPLTKQHHARLLSAIKSEVTKMQKYGGYWVGTEAWELFKTHRATFAPRRVDEVLRNTLCSD